MQSPLWRKKKTRSSTQCAHNNSAREVFERGLFQPVAIGLLVLMAPEIMAAGARHDEIQSFNIPQQRADLALTTLAEQTNLTLIFPYDKVSKITANSLVGEYSIEEAVQRLLQDTGLQLVVNDKDQFTIIQNTSNGELDPMHQKTKLSTAIVAILASMFSTQSAHSQENTVSEVDEIVVRGVRAAQEKSIDIKRNSAEIVDAVAAEDIGKLPDVTIADSLQRVTGIQIGRSNGQEGGVVSIRGLRQVLATMNGETYLTASTLTTNGADFTDIPSSIVSGMNVYKSQSATNLEGGIGGVVDLQTRRSLKLDDGLTLAGNVKGSKGNISKTNDYDINGVIGWNFDNRIATSLALSYSDSTNSNHRATNDGDRAAEASWACPSSGCKDLDGDGKLTSEIITGSANWANGYNTRETNRERLGAVYNFNMVLNDAFELNADIMYNQMDEKAAGQNVLLTNGTGRDQSHNAANPFPASGLHDASLLQQTHYATEYNTMVNGLRAGVQGIWRDTDALNTNIELKYDNGDAFTGSARWVHGEAESNWNQLYMAGVTYKRQVVQSEGAAATEINPGGIDNGNIYTLGYKGGKDTATFILDPKLAALAANPDAWYTHSGWVDGNHQKADSDVIRFDGNFKFADAGLTSVDFGLRFSDRSNTNDDYSFFSPSGVKKNGVELLNKYHESGYAIFQGTTTGTAQGITYDPLPVFRFSDTKIKPYISNVSDWGAASSGLKLTIPMLDVSKISDPIAFENYLYGEGKKINNPDKSYIVDEKKQSFNIKFNFDAPLGDSVSLTGNAGLRYIKSDVTVTRNKVDVSELNPIILAGLDSNHTTYTDLGDDVTEVSENHALPSINTTFNFGDEWKIKAAYNETMTLQNLNDLGAGTVIYYGGSVDGETFQRVSSKNNNGNPLLKPWKAGTFSLAGEWYPNDTTLLSVGYFNMQIDSFTTRTNVMNASLVDTDGIARRGAPEYTLVNGEGGSVQGYEFAYQQSFTSLPGILANTGVTFNYTYSPSKGLSTEKLANGETAPFGQGNAENQGNLILWYQDEKFQARIAANYLDKQYQGQSKQWFYGNPNGADKWIKAQLFVDLSGSYDITDKMQVNFAVNNLLKENQITYDQYENNINLWEIYERRLTLGLNAKF